MARFCPNCGAGVPDAMNFCTACGTQFPGAPQQQAGQPPIQQQQPYVQPQYQQQAYAQPQVQQPYAPAPAPPPAKKKSKAPLVIVVLVLIGGLAAAGILTKGFGLFGGKSVPVSGVTGFNATMGGQAVKMGAKLKAGSRLATGAETSVYLEVGKNSIVKMDENSEISVAEVKGGVLKFDLVKGSVLINENGKSGRVQMTAGNTRLVVRGTFFTAKYDGSDVVVDLIEGKIDVETDAGGVTNVDQGNRVTVNEDGYTALETLDVSRFDSFTRGSIVEYKGDLARGALSETDFAYIADSWGGSETGSPVYNDALVGDWGESGGSDGSEDATTAIRDDERDGGGGELSPGDGGGGEDGPGDGGGDYDRTGQAPDWNDDITSPIVYV